MNVFVLSFSSYDFHEGGTYLQSVHSSFEGAMEAIRKDKRFHDRYVDDGCQTTPEGLRQWQWSFTDRCNTDSFTIDEMVLLEDAPE